MLETLLPQRIRPSLRWVRMYPATRRLAADRRSLATIRHAQSPRSRRGERKPVKVTCRLPISVLIRPGTTDAQVALSALVDRFHMPPHEIGCPRLIWDLGANIGLTMVQMAHEFPEARIFGVELDPANASIARANLRSLGERCSLTEAAVWSNDGTVLFERGNGEDGTAVSQTGSLTMKSISLNSLLELTGPPDYVKVDIEGAEAEILREHTEWAASVRSIAVETHPPYTLDACAAALRDLGFGVRLLPQTRRRRARSTAVGIRGKK